MTGIDPVRKTPLYQNDSSGNFMEVLASPDETPKALWVTIYTNPAADMVYIHITEIIESISVFNIIGQKVFSGEAIDQLDMSHLPSGTYFIRLLSDNKSTTHKLIKK
ncbi:MAG: T9SS type A sorting domain-containing protein [Bacteroidota bacterium]